MAAIFDSTNPASPLAYGSTKTALLLMDFQGFIIDRCGPEGIVALQKAKAIRQLALSRHIRVIHSISDITTKPPAICKGADRITKMLEEIKADKSSAEEHPEIAFSRADGEYLFLKDVRYISALKSTGMMQLLRENDIRSLILCGLSTSGAVLRTALSAPDEGFVVTVIQDACADPRENIHETVLGSILPSRANVATAEEFMSEWTKQVGY